MPTTAAIELSDKDGASDSRRKPAVTEAAHYLSISESYLNKLRCRGGGPDFFKIGARVVYSVSDLDAYLDLHRRRSTSDRGAANEGGM
jgi:Helix-turn-helix domain